MMRLHRVAEEPTVLLALGHVHKDWLRSNATAAHAGEAPGSWAAAAAFLVAGIAQTGCSNLGLVALHNSPGPYQFQQAEFFVGRLTCKASYDALRTCQGVLGDTDAAARTMAKMQLLDLAPAPNTLDPPTSLPQPFHDAAGTPWLRRFQDPTIMAELRQFVRTENESQSFQPAFSASWTLPTRATDDWSAVPLASKGVLEDGHCARLPRTCGLVASLRRELGPVYGAEHVGARLLRLAPGASLRPHRGPGGRLVGHLGIAVPEHDRTAITVGGVTRAWAEGEWLVFDDSLLHSAVNGAGRPRFVLSVAFAKPDLWAEATSAGHMNIATDTFTLNISPGACTVTTTLKFDAPVKVSAAVPLLSLYNRVEDSHAEDWAPCTKVEAPPGQCPASGCASVGVLDIHAAAGYGYITLHYNATQSSIVWTVHSTSNWHGDSVERHIMFPEFWLGILESCVPTDGNCTSPTVMGKLQGPRGFGTDPGSTTLPSAGFVSITNHSFYKYMFYAVEGDAVGMTIAPSADIGHIWMDIGRNAGVLFDNENRFKSWLWTQGATGPAGPAGQAVFNHEYWVNRSLALGVQLLFISSAINTEDWLINTKEYPDITGTAAYVRAHGLAFGIHTLPYPPGNAPPENLIQDGPAPTYRSGSWSSPTRAHGLEDLGFWWGHDNEGAVAVNGNPNGPCPQLVPGYDCSRWGSNMSLHGTSWSTLGRYRAGGSIGFDGVASYGVAAHTVIWDGAGADVTLGLTMHPADVSEGTLVSRAGSFHLAFSAAHLVWTVESVAGPVAVTSAMAFEAGGCYTIKCTYNSTSSTAKILVENKLDALRVHPASRGLESIPLASSSSDIFFGAASKDAQFWHGSLEEVYLKNISTEFRQVYRYTDNVRPTSASNVRVFDLSTDHGRKYYAGVMSHILNAADFDTTQWDGFEILLLMPMYNFGHSNKTVGDSMYRGVPSADWYNLGWPLAVGQDWLAAMEETHRLTNPHTAIECSFMAPGLGPWRPDMAPYVDEHGPDVVTLGLEWHPKMLFRTLLSGLVINPYHTPLGWITNEYNISYWLGGLITTGVAPQIDDRADGKWDAVVRGWMLDYAYYGHMQEGTGRTGASMLHYDQGCCHIQGEACEWVACRDVMLSVLAGGTIGPAGTAVGLYAASPAPVVVPPHLAHNGTTILVFMARGTDRVSLSFGAPADTHISLVMMTDARVDLSGGFLLMHDEVLEITVLNATAAERRNPQFVSRRSAFGAAPVRGARALTVEAAIYQTVVLSKRAA
jgi:hypothetical protein